MAMLTPMQERSLRAAAEKDANDDTVRPAGQSRTPRTDMVLDQIKDGTHGNWNKKSSD
jgi:hypothetical protein